MSYLARRDEELKQLYNLNNNLRTVNQLNEKIKQQQNNLNATKESPFNMTHPSKYKYNTNRTKVYNRIYTNMYNKAYGACKVKKSLISIGLHTASVIGILGLAALIIYLTIAFFIPGTTELLYNQKWWLAAEITNEEFEKLYYLSLAVWSIAGLVLFGVLLYNQVVDFIDDFVSPKYVIIIGLIALIGYSIVRYFILAGWWGLLEGIVIIFGCIVHVIVFGFLCFIPYLLILASVCGGFIAFEYLHEIIGDKDYKTVNTRAISDSIYNSAEYAQALKEDLAIEPSKREEYTIQYNNAKKANDEYNEKIKQKQAIIKKGIADLTAIRDSYLTQIQNDTCLHGDQKKIDYIKILMYYIEHKRADSIKEAINVFEQEKAFKRITTELNNKIAGYQQKVATLQTDFARQKTALLEELNKIRNATNAKINSLESSIGDINNSINDSQKRMQQAVNSANRLIEQQNSQLSSINADLNIASNRINQNLLDLKNKRGRK